MPRRHALPTDLPTLWLLTDPRQGDRLWLALDRLPRGTGVIVRHHDAPDRRGIYDRVRTIARRRGLVLVLAGSARQAASWGADGAHGDPRRWPAMLRTMPAHDIGELDRAQRCGADLVLLSPLWTTTTHPGARTLGIARFAALARRSRVPVIALGGIGVRSSQRVRGFGAIGWAAIDGLTTALPPGPIRSGKRFRYRPTGCRAAGR